MRDNVRIAICGDICPTSDTVKYFNESDVNSLFNNCLDVFESSDLVMGNMEFPLLDNGISVKKTGPVLSGRTSHIDVFKMAGFNLLGMANNHIKDMGEEGVVSSLKKCIENGISTVGAGTNLTEAKKPHISKINGVKIGIMAFAEQEFNTAEQDEAGANYIDVYYDFESIRELKKNVDYLIILYHGGIEYYKYPSPELQKRCRKMVESGADLVTCQHSHCIGTNEKYLDGHIVYGQGNTIFGYRKNDDGWNRGLILKVDLEKKNDGLNANIIFCPIEATEKGIHVLPKNESSLVLEQFKGDSSNIENQHFVQKNWKQFCEQKASLYIPFILGFNRLFIHLNRITGNRLVRTLYSSRKLRTVLNIIRCESHNEVIKTILKSKGK